MSKPAVIIVDMLKDNVDVDSPHSIGDEGRKIIPNLQRLIAAAREKGIPVVFANDSYLPEDFLFKGRMKPHCIQGTRGAEVIDELKPQDTDIVLPKRHISAFFQTGFDGMLRDMGVDTIIVGGISTAACVLSTVLDGFSHDFYVVVLEDCCACPRPEEHANAITLLEGLNRPLNPLLKTMKLDEFMNTI
jgi:nicotinamidase/pyrazinamidase